MQLDLSALPFVVSDVAPLRRVVVNPPSVVDYNIDLSGGAFMEFVEPQRDAAQQHREFERLLRMSGAQVLTIEQLLDEAIEQARLEGQFETWLRAALPGLAHLLDTATASTLLGRTPEVQFQTDEHGTYRHLVDHRLSWTFTRDAAVVTPHGLVLGKFLPPRRLKEEALMRFAARFAPSLRRYPVLFDAAEEGLCLEGGDLQVMDDHTLLLGVGHRTDPRVAPLLAKRLEMDVIAVQLRKTRAVGREVKDDPLSKLFLHLDTCFTCVDRKRAVAVPYFLEADIADRDPFTRFLKGVALESTVDPDRAHAAAVQIAEIGWIQRFEAGSGGADPNVTGLKLVDFVRQQGWEVSFVGGRRSDADVDHLEHLFRVVLPEHTRQAANVVATAPGQVLAYEGAPHTRACLESCGVRVQSFNARDLWPWYGGPHCLTLPLERG